MTREELLEKYAEEGGRNLSGSDLRGSDLRGSNLRYSNLSGSNLSGSNLSGSNLSGSDLRGSNLSGSNLRYSNLSGSDLRDSNLSGASFSVSSLLRTSWSDLPDGLTLELMRHDAESCGKEAMAAWAAGGACPMQRIFRDFFFTEKRELWVPGPPQLRGMALLKALCAEKNITL